MSDTFDARLDLHETARLQSKGKVTGRQGTFAILLKYKYIISCFYKTYLHIKLWQVCKGNKLIFLWITSPFCRLWAAGSSPPFRGVKRRALSRRCLKPYVSFVQSLLLQLWPFLKLKHLFDIRTWFLKRRHTRYWKNKLYHYCAAYQLRDNRQ